MRSRHHKVVSGVCGGLGRHYDLDPVVFRVPLAVLSAVGGLGLLFYGFAWLFVPLEGEDENEGRRLLSGRVEGSALSAVLCALVGSGLFLASMGNDSGRVQLFSVLLVGAVAGAAHWSQQRRRAVATEAEGRPTDPVAAHAAAEAPPEAKAPPAPAGPSWWREPLTKEGRPGRPHDTGYLWGPEDEPTAADPYAAPASSPWGPWDPDGDGGNGGGKSGRGSGGTAVGGASGNAAGNVPRGRRSLGGLVLLLAAVAAVAGTAAAWSSQSLGTALSVGLGCALGVFGLGTAVSAFYGRVGGGTVAAIVCTGALLAGAVALPKDISTEWTEAYWHPPSAASVRDRYELGTGSAVLDLSEVEMEKGTTLRTSVEVGAGEALVLVPEDIGVRLDVEVDAGGYRLSELPGAAGGWSEERGGGFGVTDRRTLPPAGGGEPDGVLELRLRVGVGEAEVVQHATGEGR
ncbi:PspC domain-containing protein [Streptomyces taklimakanensis]|uniref:PspC domain-containing protein n=1 Tax=Streptomyces taklimakanensis TaxID=2569853 RepID=UPI00308415B7